MNFVEPIRNKKQIKAMKKALLAMPYGKRNHLLFVLGINSGIRVHDLLQLPLRAVWKKGLVNSLFIRNGEIYHRIIVKEKSGKIKTFPLSETSRKAVRQYVDSIRPDKKQKIDTHQPLFRSKKGGPITREHAWYILNQAAKEAGIPGKIGCHTLRKTFAYHAYRSGISMEVIMATLGHKTPAETLEYIGLEYNGPDDKYAGIEL